MFIYVYGVQYFFHIQYHQPQIRIHMEQETSVKFCQVAD